MAKFLVTNTYGFKKQIEASSWIRAIQEGMAQVDYTLSSSSWQAVEVNKTKDGMHITIHIGKGRGKT